MKKYFNNSLKAFILVALILLVVSLSSIYSCELQAFALESSLYEPKIYCEATIDDEFNEDCVLVVIDKYHSQINKTYDKAFFKDINISSIEDLTFIEGNPSQKDYLNDDEFRQILKLQLAEPSKQNVIDTIKKIEKINGVISLFYLICDDGFFGEYNGQLIQLYLYLSRLQWERGYRDEAFISLDKALEHAQALEKLLDGGEHHFTAPLVSLVKCRSGEPAEIASSLPEDWPFWYAPDFSRIEKEIKSDPRWTEWTTKCRE